MRSLIHNKALRALVGLLGLAVIGISLSTLVAGISMELTAGTSDIGGVVFASLCMLFTTGIGGLLTWFGYRGVFGDTPIPAVTEAEVLKLALKSDGRVSIARVAAETDLTLEQSERLLETLAKKGLARLDLDDEGDRVFVFSGLEETLLPDEQERRQS